ncbi:MAG TPA: SIR2 family protein [Longimicrobium sp.]|nr:SIR2 family protein [Longimicrobium sp.]
MEIKRSLDPRGQPTLKYRGILNELAQRLLEGKILIFLGAGCNVDDEPALPTASALSRDMADACSLEWHEYIPLSTIAFYYESFNSRSELNRFLSEMLRRDDVPPSTTLQRLVAVIQMLEERGLKTVIVTTNFDQQFEKAYRAATGRDVDVVVYNGGTDANNAGAVLHPKIQFPDLWGPSQATTLYKMHGCISAPESPGANPPQEHNLVVTEEDYINFLSNALSGTDWKKLVRYVLAQIAASTTLFIGYSLTDWNFRVVYKATAERHFTRGYAVQLFTPTHGKEELDNARHQAAVQFWGTKKVDIVNIEAATFVDDLHAAVIREIASHPARATA